MKKFITESAKDTQKIAVKFAEQILHSNISKSAIVLGLQGDLGAGKTTFLQGFAKGLRIKEKINSPTFVILKRFKIQDLRFKNFYHIDCYRLNSAEEILDLGFKEIISNSENIVAIEWPEKIYKILPKNILEIKFKHLEENKREITFNFGSNIKYDIIRK